MKLPHFENILSEDSANADKLVETFTNSDCTQNSGRGIDVTGKRVNTHAELVQTSHYLRSACKNISRHNTTEDTCKVCVFQSDMFKYSELVKPIMKKNAKIKSTFL